MFWDIDGTLLRTNRAGLYAFEQATKDLLGIPPDFKEIQTAGMTDYYIADQIIRCVTGGNPTHREITQLISRYEELLPKHLERHRGYLLPSVFALLTVLHEHPAFISLLLTGNTPAGARTKLSYFAIDGFFDFTLGAFCLDCLKRSDIAARAKQIVQDRYPHIPFERVYVIGDTPYDIDCGKFIGARTIGVATGTYSFAGLAACKPWWALETLPAPEEFIAKLNKN